jgi:aryl-alcohol dehydrogenase-like predicted oxidoreductase
LVELINAIAQRKNASAAQVALAWVMVQKPFIVPIPGMAKLKYVEDNIKSENVMLTAEDLNEIEEKLAGINIQGERLSQALLDMDDTF